MRILRRRDRRFTENEENTDLQFPETKLPGSTAGDTIKYVQVELREPYAQYWEKAPENFTELCCTIVSTCIGQTDQRISRSIN